MFSICQLNLKYLSPTFVVFTREINYISFRCGLLRWIPTYHGNIKHLTPIPCIVCVPILTYAITSSPAWHPCLLLPFFRALLYWNSCIRKCRLTHGWTGQGRTSCYLIFFHSLIEPYAYHSLNGECPSQSLVLEYLSTSWWHHLCKFYFIIMFYWK